jgi:rare lipoprotein A (peptidoglycan hydrolase)
MRRRNYGLSGWPLLAALTLLLWPGEWELITKSEDSQRVETVAEQVKGKAARLEKAEGKNGLIKDAVEVKTNAKGKTVIEQIGEASWYGPDFHGKTMASGKAFNQYDLTAAHPTFPLGTKAIVTNLKTGESVKVEITDRGPYAKGRDIDLSKQAAIEIGMTKDGTVPVKIEAEVPPRKTRPNQR